MAQDVFALILESQRPNRLKSTLGAESRGICSIIALQKL